MSEQLPPITNVPTMYLNEKLVSLKRQIDNLTNSKRGVDQRDTLREIEQFAKVIRSEAIRWQEWRADRVETVIIERATRPCECESELCPEPHNQDGRPDPDMHPGRCSGEGTHKTAWTWECKACWTAKPAEYQTAEKRTAYVPSDNSFDLDDLAHGALNRRSDK